MVSSVTNNSYVVSNAAAAKTNKTEATKEVAPETKADQIAKQIDEGTYKLLPLDELAKAVADKINF